MRVPITITDAEGGAHVGIIPTNWDDVPLVHYTALAVAQSPEARRAALATITELPALAFEEDEDLLPNLLLAAPFLYKGPLPAGEPAPTFEHASVTYHYVGDLSTIGAYQFQAAIDGLPEALPEPERWAAVVPHLLAMIYTPAGSWSEQFAQLADAPAALATVPMSVGWPALMHLVTTVGPRAVAAGAYHAVRAEAEHLISTVEQQLLSSPPRGVAQKVTHALARKGLQQARNVISPLGSKSVRITNYTPPKKKRSRGTR